MIPRARVTSLLAPAWARRVTLVVAGAGYGKTTALTQLTQPGVNAAWIQLRPATAAIETVTANIAAALGQPPRQPASALAMATGPDDRQALAEHLAAELCELAETPADDLLLLVDGLEHAAADVTVSHLLRVLALEGPERLHLVLSGRRLPELGLGGAQGRGELLEVTAPDLCFTLDETTSLISARLGSAAEVADELAAECLALTGGWPAALRLLIDQLARAPHLQVLDRVHAMPGRLWGAFAADLAAAETPDVREILAVAAVAPRVDAALLAGVSVQAGAQLEPLRERGLLVEAGGPGWYRLSPVLAGAFARDPADVVRWLEASGRLGDALECHAAGPPGPAREFCLRHGEELIRDGAATRLVEVLRRHGTGGDPALSAVLASALHATGDWDTALDLYSRLPSSPAVAWRHGLLLYLRGETREAVLTLNAARDPHRLSPDAAMVSAWLSSALWNQGQTDQAADLAITALSQATASGDPAAVAAAHVACALAAAAKGDRERNDQEYRLAIAAAREARDHVQLARVHANLSSRALEEGSYPLAIKEAELALAAGAGHRFFAALALINKSEAHLRLGQLGEAHGAATEAADILAALGSLAASMPAMLQGELYRQRGDVVRARTAFERARTLAEASGYAHAVVFTQCGLAKMLAVDDIAAARKAGAEAVEKASSLERAQALCAAAEVELWGQDGAAAARLAEQAEIEGRATGDLAALAESLQLQAIHRGDLARLQAAIGCWEDIGAAVEAARARLCLAMLTDDEQTAENIRRALVEAGAGPDVGLPALLAVRRRIGGEAAIVTLGRFVVLRAGEPVPLAEWQSRKARELLKLLVARRGHPVTRDAAVEAIWPGEPPWRTSNRLSVALSVIRKVLDPGRLHQADYFIVADAQAIALRLDNAEIDLVTFLRLAEHGADLADSGSAEAAATVLRRARQVYVGDFLEEDLYEEWAVDTRDEARSRLLDVLRLLARLAAEHGADEAAGQYLGQLLERDPYDEQAWLALIASLRRTRRHGEARRRYAAYARRMGELDVTPVPFTEAASTLSAHSSRAKTPGR